MNRYEKFTTHLDQLLMGAPTSRSTMPDSMPLSVEEIGCSEERHRSVSVCHYGEQNRDLIQDPDIVFLFYHFSGGMGAEPITSRNDDLGIAEVVYGYDEAGRDTSVSRVEIGLEGVCSSLICRSSR